MSHPNPFDDSPQFYVADGFTADPPEYGGNEDKATQTRRKNAEAQKLYRERKKQYEATLVSKVQHQQERINQLEAQLALEREKQNHTAWPLGQGWLDSGPPLPPYSQNQTYIAPIPVPQTGRFHYQPDPNFGALDAKYMQSSSAVNALFQVTYDNPYSPIYSRSTSSYPV